MAASFQNKVILITGAGSGIGRATSIKLSTLGATLALTDINSPSLSSTATLCSNPATHLTSAFDISDSTAVNQFIASITSKHTHINHIFNCAGVNPTRQPTSEITDAYWDNLINTNLKGLFNVTRACIPHLQSGSSIVNVSSIAALRPSAGFAVYCATKAGVIAFSKAMALELGPTGVRVNVVAPGSVDTPSNAAVVEGREAVERERERVSLGRIGTVEEIADVVVFLMGEESRYMNGSVVEVNGGVY